MATAQSPLARQPDQLDYASPTQFRFGIHQLPKVEFFTVSANLPGISAGTTTYATPFKDIPMSTTWVFVGLLCGREFAIATVSNGAYKLKHVFPIVGKDFLKMMLGLFVSVGIVIGIHSI